MTTSTADSAAAATSTSGAHGEGGERRALFIAVSYKGSKQALNGCVRDQERMCAFVRRLAPDCAVRMLCDDPASMRDLPSGVGVHGAPTRANILDGVRWLRDGTQLWISFSGHGHWQYDRSRNSDEVDRRDETIVPCDWERAGQITDDELRRELVQPLGDGVRLTAVFDCCHSGTVLDLRCNYLDESKYVGGGSERSVRTYVPAQWRRRLVYETHPHYAETRADVAMWSGCRDTQTSADAAIGGKYEGAMSHAFLHFADPTQPGHALRAAHTPGDLLQDMNGWLKVNKYEQRPQLSFGKPTDVDAPWTIFTTATTATPDANA